MIMCHVSMEDITGKKTNSLKTMSLDDSVSQVIEETIDMEEVIL